MVSPIRIRRRISGAAGAASGLLNAEPFFNEIDSTLYIGIGVGTGAAATNVLAIGGPGTFATRSWVTSSISAADISSQLSAYITTATANSTFATAASAALTGTPTATTPSAGDSSTKIATTAFVSGAVSALVNGAGAALDTLKELGDALGSDANFATTVSTNLAGKCSKASNLSDISDAATARTNLGLSGMAQQAASAVAITGGTIDGVTIDGGSY